MINALKISDSAPHARPLTARQAALKPRLTAANINEKSFLATDYLNHFNEVVMLLEMVPDMLDMLEDCADWSPKTYQKHFADSGFADKALAIEAYENAPEPSRTLFDNLTQRLNTLILDAVADITALVGDQEALSYRLDAYLSDMRMLLSALNGVIHGKTHMDEDLNHMSSAISEKDPSADTTEAASQADIDALFD